MKPSPVRAMMSCPVYAIEPGRSLDEAMTAMEERHVRHLPVITGRGRLVGLLTDRDLWRAALDLASEWSREAERVPVVRDFMTVDLTTVGPDQEISQAAELFLKRRIGCLPVIERGRLVGIITGSDFVRFVRQSRQKSRQESGSDSAKTPHAA